MVILASKSPRRRELLKNICDFQVREALCDENCSETDPEKLVRILSERKASAVSASAEDVVIGADTVVAVDGMILGKPKSAEDAKKMLSALSGKTHQVFTGVTVIRGDKKVIFSECTHVTFYPLGEQIIDDYIATNEPFDKAGAYGIQGRGCLLVEKIDGDYFNVVGLPVARLYRTLQALGGENTHA